MDRHRKEYQDAIARANDRADEFNKSMEGFKSKMDALRKELESKEVKYQRALTNTIHLQQQIDYHKKRVLDSRAGLDEAENSYRDLMVKLQKFRIKFKQMTQQAK